MKPGFARLRAGNLGFIARTFVIAMGVAAILIGVGTAHADWRVLDHPEAVATFPRAVTGDTVVGIYWATATESHGFVYDGENWTDLDFPGAVYTQPYGISGDKIVGAYTTDPNAFSWHGFVYDGTTWTTLDYPDSDSPYTYAFGIEGDTIVGNYLDTVYSLDVGFIYDGNTWTPFFYPPSEGTFVNGISGDTLVGDYRYFDDNGEEHFGAYLHDGMGFSLLDFEGAWHTWGWGIAGDLVTGYYFAGPPGNHGYLHNRADATWKTLDFPGATATHPYGIDGKSIVGDFKVDDTTHGFIYSLAPDPSSHSARAEGWVVGSAPADGYGVILHTVNGGHEWVRQGSVGEVPNVAFYSVKAVDRHTAWVAGAKDSGYGVILRTDDGGQTWTRQGQPGMIPGVELHGVGAANRKTAWAIGDKGTILRTGDGGKTWTPQASGTDSYLFEMAVVNSRIAWIVGNADNMGYAVILHTTDGGRTWKRQGTAEILSGQFALTVTAVNAQTAWVVGQGGFAAKTTDGGESWEIQMKGTLNDNNDVCGVTPNTAWIATDYNIVYRTTDGGTTWDLLDLQGQVLGSYYLLGVSAWGADTAWVIGSQSDTQDPGGIILHTMDGGATWRVQLMTVNVPFDRGVSFVGSSK